MKKAQILFLLIAVFSSSAFADTATNLITHFVAKANRQSGKLSSDDLGNLRQALRKFNKEFSVTHRLPPEFNATSLFADMAAMHEMDTVKDHEALQYCRLVSIYFCWSLVTIQVAGEMLKGDPIKALKMESRRLKPRFLAVLT